MWQTSCLRTTKAKQPMTEQLSREELAEIRARVEAATPGPWELVDYELVSRDESTVREAWGDEAFTEGGSDEYMLGLNNCPHNEQDIINLLFIATARTDIPALISTVDALKGEVELVNTALRAAEAERDAQAVEVARLREALGALFRDQELGVRRWADNPSSCTYCGESSCDSPDGHLYHADTCAVVVGANILAGAPPAGDVAKDAKLGRMVRAMPEGYELYHTPFSDRHSVSYAPWKLIEDKGDAAYVLHGQGLTPDAALAGREATDGTH